MFRGRLPVYRGLITSDSRSLNSESTSSLIESPSEGGRPVPAYELPPFIRIINILLLNSQSSDDNSSKNFITNVASLHDATFSPKCPILGTGHHFMVYASPFDASDRDFTPIDGRAINNEVYCLKIANFASNRTTNTGSSEDFRKDYYHTVLQELRVLLHPRLRSCENVINLFGLDFHEDCDDYTLAWPVLVMEYAEHGTLDSLQEDISIDFELARVLLLDVARGIHALHQCNIIHGDVKSENVVICRHHQRKYVARLADFGLSLINPNAEVIGHRLPGGTFLWSAPEFDQALSVFGLKQTDVYSFGLMVWRVLVRNPVPYILIPPLALGFHTSVELNETVSCAKSHGGFGQLVLQTIHMHNGAPPKYSRPVIEATLSTDPMSRNLGRAIWELSQNQEQVVLEVEANEAYWAFEEPSVILEQLDEDYPNNLVQFAFKPSVLYSLRSGLEAVFSSTSELAHYAGWFLFRFASSPQFPVLGEDADECCRILMRLYHLESALAVSILVDYHKLHGKKPNILNPSLLEAAASNGSYYALNSLRTLYPEMHLKLVQSPLDFKTTSESSEEASLVRYCREGDFARCKMALEAGDSAYPSQDGVASALHWLVSFPDEHQITYLLGLLLENGAVIDAWEGDEDEDNFTFGRAVGTPLHWAVWYRNIPLVRALTKVDSNPEVRHVDRAISIAASMHFYDVLEVLKEWIVCLRSSKPSKYNWSFALLSAASNSFLLPRRLRHGDKNLQPAFEQTMDIISAVQRPSADDIKKMFLMAITSNNPELLRYLFNRLSLGKRKDLLGHSTYVVQCIMIGFNEIFEIFIEQGHISPNTEYGTEKFKPLQLCCISRQRDPSFVTRLIDIGCPVDSTGNTDLAKWTPFAFSVSLGLYDIAILLLERGADKDHISGWAGGSTVTMNLLQSWPDVPISRLKFLLEDIPRLGFGHVTFWGWPGAGGNLLYALSMSHWSAYTSGYRLAETAKYILSTLADKSCLNRVDRIGSTALRMACVSGNLEIIQTLIEAGQDVNLSIGFSPLRNAKEWLAKCQDRLSRANASIARGNASGAERRLAQTMCTRAQKSVELLEANGAIDRGVFEAMNNTTSYITNGQWQRPSFETVLEMFSLMIDRSPAVDPGSTPLHPTSGTQFRVHHGQKSTLQKLVGNWGRRIDKYNGESTQTAMHRYQPHNCLPWRSDICASQGNQAIGSRSENGSTHPSTATAQPYARGVLSPSPGNFTPNCPPQGPWQSGPSKLPSKQKVESVIENIRNLLLHYFLDGDGVEANEEQRQEHAVRILQEQLQVPIILDVPRPDIGLCKEFFYVKTVVESCLETMSVTGVTLVPELSDDGRELVVHVGGHTRGRRFN